MKKITQFLLVTLFIATSTMYGQTLTGTVMDDSNQPLPGADVILDGTTKGASTDFSGNFSLDVTASSGTVTVSFIGYTSKNIAFTVAEGETVNLGTIQLEASQEALDEIVIVGVADIVRDRQTPIAVSTIKAAEIQELLGSQELPEILNSTPSVYATKSGGGYGDSRINIRGFDQRNTAVLINGVPVNDMENGWVFWSNWAGLADVTSAMQVQRGLGSSKLAISSVGGTINVLTRTASAKKGGAFAISMGNDAYLKTLGSYNTGKLDNGLSISLLLSQTQGNGYIDGTEFLGNNYFIGIGYQPNDNNNFQFTYTGAPQWHNQNSRSVSISNAMRYGDGTNPNRKYNEQWGYLDGKVYTWRRNFYHKPIMSVNWDWKMNDNSSLSSVVYASWGRGGGSGPIGEYRFTAGGRDRRYQSFQLPRTNDGLVDFEFIRRFNQGQETINSYGTTLQADPSLINSRRNAGFSRRASMNSHNWYGIISNFSHDFNENLTWDIGVDLRTYTGIHYRVVNDVIGADGYFDNRDDNNPNRTISEFYAVSPNWNPFANIKDQQKIEYYNDGNVNWLGAFTQLEYKTDNLSAFLQGAVSQQGFKRVDYFNELPPNQETDFENILGGNIKGGVNFKFDDANNVFINSGYYSKQPIFDAVWINFRNNLNPDLQNEKVFGLEVGYGFRGEKISANLNFYRTSWKDRFESITSNLDVNNTPNDDNDDVRGTANLYGIQQIHTGIEFDMNYKVSEKLNFKGMLSIGNWEYKGNVTANYFDNNQDPISGFDTTLYLDGVKVGDAAQMTGRIAGSYKITEMLKFDSSWYFANNLYAQIDATDFDDENHQGSLKLPSYDKVDVGISYKLPLNDGDQSINFRVNVNNAFDEVYIAESDTNRFANPGDDTYKGINTRNRVYWGFGRTWNFTMKYNF